MHLMLVKRRPVGSGMETEGALKVPLIVPLSVTLTVPLEVPLLARPLSCTRRRPHYSPLPPQTVKSPARILYAPLFYRGPGMTGRPGYRTMEMNGRSTVSYLVRTPRVPFFMHYFIGLEAKGRLAFQGRCGIASVVRWNLSLVIFGVDFVRPPPLEGYFQGWVGGVYKIWPSVCWTFRCHFSLFFRGTVNRVL